MEAIGDITASAEVSRQAVDGEEFDSRIQGGVLVSLFPPPSLPQSLTRPPPERRPRRLLLRPLYRHPPLRLRPEQRRHRDHPLREPDSRPFLLLISHTIWRPWQDLRCLPC